MECHLNFCMAKTNFRFKNGCQLETTLQRQAVILPGTLYQEKQSLGLWVCLLPAGRLAALLKCTIIEFLNVHLASHCVLYILNRCIPPYVGFKHSSVQVREVTAPLYTWNSLRVICRAKMQQSSANNAWKLDIVPDNFFFPCKYLGISRQHVEPQDRSPSTG